MTLPVRPSLLEARVLELVVAAVAGRPVESTRVEFKAQWPADLYKAARQIAGHANAAFGEPVLWVIGVDEKARAVVPFEAQDITPWWAGVHTYFEDVAPTLAMSLPITTDEGPVYALLFDTGRAPFVVRNPEHGKKNGGPIAWEVPWREGASVRSAKRRDLLRILVRALQQPTFEVYSASVEWAPSMRKDQAGGWKTWLTVYVVPLPGPSLVIPKRECAVTLRIPGMLEEETRLWALEIEPERSGLKNRPSQTIIGSDFEISMTGPGLLRIEATQSVKLLRWESLPAKAYLRAVLYPVHVPAPLDARVELERVENRPVWSRVKREPRPEIPQG